MLEQFFAGILHQLQAEVDLINSLVPHNATKGSLNEESLKRILSSFLPNRYAIGTGFVIDSLGNRSAQVDVIIYEGIHSSKLFNNFSQVIYPVETVFACIEIKTSIDKAGLMEIAQENKRIASLKHYYPRVTTIRTSSTANAIEISDLDTRPPLTFTVNYHTQTDNPLTVRKWFEECSEKEHLPDATLFLDLGLVILRPNPKEKLVFDFLLMPVRNTDADITENGILYLSNPCETHLIKGRIYKSSKWKGKEGNYPIIMPEKALLNFLVQLNRAIDSFPKHDSFDPTPYLAHYSNEGLEVLDNENI